MFARKAVVIALIVFASGVWLGGCPTAADGGRLCNQPGPMCSDIFSAGLKLLQNRLDLLNPDDIQVLSDTAIVATGAPVAQLTDTQAQAVVNVMQANDIDTLEDLQNFIALVQANPGAVEISDADLAVLIQLANVDVSGFGI